MASTHWSTFTKLSSALRLLLICTGGGCFGLPYTIVEPPERNTQLCASLLGSIKPIRLFPPSLLHKIMPFYCQHLCTNVSFSRTSSLRYFFLLTHRGRVTLKCVVRIIIIGSDGGLSSGQHQANVCTNAGMLLIGPLGMGFDRNQHIFIREDAFENVV